MTLDLTVEQYLDRSFTPHHQRLSDETYATVLDSCVLACVDVLVYRNNQILLGRRQQKPAAGREWILGGRMIPGESFEQTAQRVMRQETGIEIEDTSRFACMGIKNYVWPDREQPPQSNGCHLVGIYYAIEISHNEANLLAHRADFSSFRWVNRENVTPAKIQCHPALQSLAQQLLEWF